jgi:hypothetical protein
VADPVGGGSCNNYDYVCGDPINRTDLSGQGEDGSGDFCLWCFNPTPGETYAGLLYVANAGGCVRCYIIGAAEQFIAPVMGAVMAYLHAAAVNAYLTAAHNSYVAAQEQRAAAAFSAATAMSPQRAEATAAASRVPNAAAIYVAGVRGLDLSGVLTPEENRIVQCDYYAAQGALDIADIAGGIGFIVSGDPLGIAITALGIVGAEHSLRGVNAYC